MILSERKLELGASSCWNEREVVGWIQASGLLAGRSVERVTAMSGHTTAAVVSLGDRSAFFVKKSRNEGRSDGAIQAAVARRDDLEGIRGLFPRFVLHDEKDGVVVVEGLTDRVSMREMCRWRPPGKGALVRSVAAALARLHVESRGACLSGDRAPRVPRAMNPVPNFGSLSPAEFARMPGARFPEFFAAAQEVGGALQSLEQSWSSECFVHGDFKDDNVMVGGSEAEPLVTFVDWEMAGWGDPAWDVGGMVGQFLYHWITSMKPGVGDSLRSLVQSATVPFSLVHESATAFVSTYASVANVENVAAFVARVVRFAGVFLFHRARTILEISGRLPPAASSCLQVGKTIISDHARGAQIIFGSPS